MRVRPAVLLVLCLLLLAAAPAAAKTKSVKWTQTTNVGHRFADEIDVVTIEIPSDGSGSAYVNGQPYRSDPGLSNTCL